jgi:DNA-binding MarR family transcriptional regulator
METKYIVKPPVSKLESHLGYLLRRVSNAVSGEFARALHTRQTSVAEWVLLTMTRGAVSKIIDKLQTKGWIRSRISPQDNRVQVLSLTRGGERILPQLAELAARNDERFFASLDAGERSALRRLLGKLEDHHQMHEVPVE